MTAHAKCLEIVPGDMAVENMNRRLAEGVDLAPVQKDSIRLGSLTLGHTNLGLRCIQAGAPSSVPLLSRDGRMCLDKIEARDPDVAKAVQQGLHWKVLRWVMRVRYPKLLDIIQAAGNSQAQRPIHEVQGIAAMHRAAASSQEPDWESIKRAVLRTLPPWADDVDSLIAFAVSKSGAPRDTTSTF